MEPITTERRILQLGSSTLQEQIESMLVQKLLVQSGACRYLPSALLWGTEASHQMRAEWSDLPEVYAIRDEINLLNCWADEISQQIPDGSVLIDLGCGDVSKVHPVLHKLEEQHKQVSYYALDICGAAVNKCLSKIPRSFRFVKCTGLCGSFNDVREWCTKFKRPIWFLSLGSIFGNDEFKVAVHDLEMWSSIMRPCDRMLLGLDGCKEKEKVWRSYNDSLKTWDRMIRNGLALSNEILGHQWYRPEDWEITGSCKDGPRHRFIIRARNAVRCDALNLMILPGDEILTTEWFKYGPEEMQLQFQAAGFRKVNQWKSPSGDFYEYLLSVACD